MLGRPTPRLKNQPRIIDIDILFHGDAIIETDELILPHPMIAFRKFILIPFAEIEPEFHTRCDKRGVFTNIIDRVWIGSAPWLLGRLGRTPPGPVERMLSGARCARPVPRWTPIPAILIRCL